MGTSFGHSALENSLALVGHLYNTSVRATQSRYRFLDWG
jgi:hypothetical protein